MYPRSVYDQLLASKKARCKQFIVLIDPDKMSTNSLDKIVDLAMEAKIDYLFVGGSLIVNNDLDYCLKILKERTTIPIILFPGSTFQINNRADAILFLSVISGRNPELLIGQQVIAAPYIMQSGLEPISTGYMIIEGGNYTTVSYISNTAPIPANKDEIALCTAMAGSMLGMKTIYMDAGSGAKTPIRASMIHSVSKAIQVPLIVGGGIRTPEQAFISAEAGADAIVVGNAIERDPHLMLEIAAAVHSASSQQILSNNSSSMK